MNLSIPRKIFFNLSILMVLFFCLLISFLNLIKIPKLQGPINIISEDNEGNKVNSASEIQNKFYIYYDFKSDLNHYYPSGWMGDVQSIKLNENCQKDPYNGQTCILNNYSGKGSKKWAGVYWQHPSNNWGDNPNGWGIKDAKRLIFWAKGENGGEKIEFKCGGIKGKYADTLPIQTTNYVSLTKEWKRYIIDLKDLDTSRIAGGFCWVSNVDKAPKGALFYLDNIYFELEEKICGEPTLPGFIVLNPKSMDYEGAVLDSENAEIGTFDLIKEDVEGTVVIGQDPGANIYYNDGRNGGAISTIIRMNALYENLGIKIVWNNDNKSGLQSNDSEQKARLMIDEKTILNLTLNEQDETKNGWIIEQSPFKFNFKPEESEFQFKIKVDEGVIWKISRIIIHAYTNNNVILDKDFGFCYGPYRQGQSPNLSEFPSIKQIWDDLCLTSILTRKIRTYSVESTLSFIPKIAKNFGISTIAGVWLSSNQTYNSIQINKTIKIANLCKAIIVGNEVLLRGDLHKEELIKWIRYVKSNVSVNVSYADIYGIYLNQPNITDEVDFITAHIYAFWENKQINESIDFTVEKYNQLKSKYPNEEIIIGELGWPSEGKTGCSIENQAYFFKEWIKLAQNDSLSGYFFEIFDEPWKTEGGVGSFWGVFNKNRLPKEAGNYLLDIISSKVIANPSNNISGYNFILFIISFIGISSLGLNEIRRKLKNS